ncbi:MAG: hypothetical protein Q4Q58_05645, partial [Thermoplasmata archaeon]|nr:hypothetical protein [Thermoplasmata archaeon]
IGAVSKAIGRDIDVEEFSDRLALKKGCYILNSWGFGPKYRYGLYIRGPYSRELADDYYEMGSFGDETDIPSETVDRLSEIYGKGLEYVEAYATVLLLKNNSPNASAESIRKTAMGLKPHLITEVLEASTSLLS